MADYMKSPGKAGIDPAARLRKAIEESGAERKRVDPKSVEAMHAESVDKAFTRDGWIFELKLDGYRLIASKSHGESLLLTRNGNDYTGVFPEIARAVKALSVDECIIDGEVVVTDEKGLPSFARLQRRGTLSAPLDVKRAAVEFPSTFFAFDLIAFEDFDLRSLPLLKRKEFLAEVVPKLGPVRTLDHIEREGEAFLDQVAALGLEGIIAKKADEPYRKGRSSQWLKIKREKTDDFVIVGYTEPKRSRVGIGALQLADYVNGALVYAGRVGTGFNDGLLKELKTRLDPIERTDPACAGPILKEGTEPVDSIPEIATTTWVHPKYACEVRFREWTPDGVLRHPAFLRLRDDKPIHECVRQNWAVVSELPADPVVPPKEPLEEEPSNSRDPSAASAPQRPPQPIAALPAVPAVPAVPEKSVIISNPKKIYWPAEKYTKGDMIDYYRAISPWLLPYLKDRPIVLTRFPDGIDGKSFYQKDAPESAPSWMRTVPIWSTDTQRDIRYFVCDDVESIEYVANMGSIPLHIWMSRVGSLDLPDYCVIDLDPKEAPFSDVIKCAQVLHRTCEEVGLQNYVKTTGKSGLHILIPLGRQFTYEQCRVIGELLARMVIRELGDISTITRHVTKRGDKVYLDYLQNRHGQTIVAPFSVRPLLGATVSMPLMWDEVNQDLDPRNYTIRNAVERMERFGVDPVAPALDGKPDLPEIISRLSGAA